MLKNGLYILLLTVSVACEKGKIVDHISDIKEQTWTSKNIIQIPVSITDHSKEYSMAYSFRFNADYPFANMYVRKIMKDDQGMVIKDDVQSMELFHAETGEPFGSGFGDTRDYLIFSDRKYTFPKAGKYSITLQQYMRTDTLKGIEAVGFQIKDLSVK